MADFINTVDVLGDDAVIDSIINRTITEFKDDSVITIGPSAFYGCKQLTEVDCPAVTIIDQNAFYGASMLSRVNFPNAVELHPYKTTASSAFRNCTSLRTAVFPEVTSINGYYLFAGCDNLKWVDFPKLIGWYCQFTFPNVSTFKGVFLRSTAAVCVQGVGATIGFAQGHVYVPKTMDDGRDGIAAYEAASNWSTFAGRFRYIEDYTVDGTLTGEIDENKI